jgi:hypothetical protein
MKIPKTTTKKKHTKEQQKLIEAVMEKILADKFFVKNQVTSATVFKPEVSYETMSIMDAEAIAQSPTYLAFIAALPAYMAEVVLAELPNKLHTETRRLKKKLLVGKVLSKLADSESAEFEKLFYIGDIK